MTMAPGQKRRSFWLELLFISILVFLLMSARSQHLRRDHASLPVREVSTTLFATPASLR